MIDRSIRVASIRARFRSTLSSATPAIAAMSLCRRALWTTYSPRFGLCRARQFEHRARDTSLDDQKACRRHRLVSLAQAPHQRGNQAYRDVGIFRMEAA